MFNYKIAEARVAKGWTQSELAKRIGTTQQQVARYESGENDVKASVMVRISKALDVTLSYLLGMENASIPNNSTVDVPLYGSIAAGTPMEMVASESSQPVPVEVQCRYPSAFLLRVQGESMNRVLPNGCYALIDPEQTEPMDNRAYAVCVNGFDATVKRVRRLQNGFELVPDSLDPTFKPTVYDYGEPGTETVTVIGRVVYYVLPFDWEV